MKKLNYKKLLVLSALFLVPFFVDSQVNSSLDVNVQNVKVESQNQVRTQTETQANTAPGQSQVETLEIQAETRAKVQKEEAVRAKFQAQVETETTAKKTEPKTSAEIKDLTDALKNVKDISKTTESEIRAEIKSGIDKSIIDIRSQKDIEAYELQRVVDTTRNQIYQDLEETFKGNIKPVSVEQVEAKVNQALSNIETGLENFSNVEVDLDENRRSIKNTLLKYEEQIRENRKVIQEREGELIAQDSDGDGVSDYDEKNIYGTDPNNPKTAGGDLSDGEKISRGINPLSETLEPIDYDDPREDEESFVSELYTVTKVELISNEATGQANLKLQGQALPNSFITIYIFSTPIIVTVKTDERGEWQYTLDRELENGNHEVYVATVNNSGKIVAKSNPVPFTKTAQAAVLGSVNLGNEVSSGNFFQDNFIAIAIGIVLLALLLTLIFTGNKKGNNPIDEIKV